jgi:lysyl-tRNA synthetase class 2
MLCLYKNQLLAYNPIEETIISNMSSDDIRSERLKKLEMLKEAGIDPYPAESERTHDNASFLNSFDECIDSGKTITLGGRIMSFRDQGGLVFVDLFDGTDRVQTIIKKDEIGEGLFNQFLDFVGTSDFIEVTGVAFVTKRGTNSLLASSWRMTAKSIRQIPDEWFGLKDEDERYRKRYIDMLLNPDVIELIKKRSIFWNAIRSFMLTRDFVEVETPVLEIKTGGAEARPFITHHNALDIEVYLRISHELWHKKLIIGGLPKVFEIGRVFRNEGMSYEHAQDYTHFEFYEAYQDARGGVPMLIDLYRTVAQKTFGTLKFQIGEHVVDLEEEWKLLEYNELMKEHYGFDPREVDQSPKAGRKLIQEYYNKAYDGTIEETGRAVDFLWKQIRKTIAGPAILTGIPVYLEPLAKKTKSDPRVVDRFQIILGGSEVGKAFNELNDPLDQRERFEEQQALRDAGDEEAHMADFEYIEAMEYGMPPTFGFGVSERFFSFLAGKSIREAQAFPLMRERTQTDSKLRKIT